MYNTFKTVYNTFTKFEYKMLKQIANLTMMFSMKYSQLASECYKEYEKEENPKTLRILKDKYCSLKIKEQGYLTATSKIILAIATDISNRDDIDNMFDDLVDNGEDENEVLLGANYLEHIASYVCKNNYISSNLNSAAKTLRETFNRKF